MLSLTTAKSDGSRNCICTRGNVIKRADMKVGFRLTAIILMCFLLTSCFSFFGKKDDSSANTKPKPADNKSISKPAVDKDTTDVKGESEKLKSEEFDSDTAKELPKKETEKDKEAEQEPARKHDHAKLVAKIRQKAEEQVSQIKDCVLARLCQDNMMQSWDLYVYYKDAKQYWYDVFVWNDIEEKWGKQDLPVDRRPLKDWQNHLTFQEARKTCKILKDQVKDFKFR